MSLRREVMLRSDRQHGWFHYVLNGVAIGALVAGVASCGAQVVRAVLR